MFNEVSIWYVDKMTKGRAKVLVYFGEGHEPKMNDFGYFFCSNEILACHRDYGEMVYSSKTLKKGCLCNGI